MSQASFSKSLIILALVAGSAILYPACKSPEPAETPAEKKETTTTTLPAFMLAKPDGSKLDLQSFKGRKVMVNLWATWCGPCRLEMPSIAALYASIDTTKTALILLSLDDKEEKAVAFMKGHPLSKNVYFPTDDLPDLFNVPGIPASFIFDEKGNLMEQILGSRDFDTDEFRRMLK